MPLKNLDIKNAKSKSKPYKLFDSGGLYLLIHSNGSKYWRLKYRLHKKEKVLALGVYPDVSLAKARNDRDDAKKDIKAGTDPVAKRKEQKNLALLNSENTFEVVALEWHQQQKERWSPTHAERVIKSLRDEAFPQIGFKPITNIATNDLIAILRKIEKRGALDYASRVLQRLTAVFRYAVQTGRLTINPATELKGVLKTRKTTHRSALQEKDLPDFLNKLDTYKGEPLTVLGLKLLVLTFIRPGELRHGEWKEIDFKKAEWRIPAERMKMRTEHIVPLSDQAISILKELKKHSGRYDLMFPNRNRDGKVMSENTLTYAIRKRLGFDATAHGFRATASTILNEQGWRPDVIERQLAHAEKNKVRAAYHRSEYLQERTKMMQGWADYLDTLRKR